MDFRLQLTGALVVLGGSVRPEQPLPRDSGIHSFRQREAS
jgi:hypothetical protein